MFARQNKKAAPERRAFQFTVRRAGDIRDPGANLNSFKTFIQPVVQKDAAALAERADAFLLEADINAFTVSHLNGVRFGNRFVDVADPILDFLLVHPDMKLSEQLTKGVFDEVTFYYSYFQTEFHREFKSLLETC